ncbi:Arm DNA-binding domain-containing protein [Thalassotalea litorea]|uniref:Arm DNA-binding domain-containing protein n=1 Tax=Thalassotalea litorea TaxID=2020715 RepID=UPI003734F0EA
MAHLRFPKNGNIQFDLHIYGHRFRESSGLANTPANLSKARKRLKRINAEIALGTFEYRQHFPNSRKTSLFTQLKREKLTGTSAVFFDDYMNAYVARNQHQWRTTYVRCLKSTLSNYVLPYFAHLRIDDVTLAHAQQFRDQLCQLRKQDGTRKLSNKRINNILVPVISLMRLACDELNIRYPFDRLKALREEPSDPSPLTQDEVRRFLTYLDPHWHDYYLLRFHTGMRSCEVHGLLKECVDFEHRRILVRRNFVEALTDVKTRKSRRDIHMTPTLYQALQRAVNAMPEGRNGDKDFVFTKPSGKPLTTHFVARSLWYPTLKKAGLGKRRPYQTRHTAAVLHLAAHENPLYVSRLLGHAGTRMLYEVYAPFVQNLYHHDGSAFEKMMRAQTQSTQAAVNEVVPFDDKKRAG